MALTFVVCTCGVLSMPSDCCIINSGHPHIRATVWQGQSSELAPISVVWIAAGCICDVSSACEFVLDRLLVEEATKLRSRLSL